MTTPMLRTSERRAFKRCQQRWWWAYREGLRRKGSPSTPLWFGTGVHLALSEWYCGPGTKRGPHPAETWVAYAKEELAYIKTVTNSEEEVEEWVSAEELGRVLMEEYVKEYGRDEHKLIIQAEQTFSLPVPWPDATRQKIHPDATPGELLTVYKGTYDSAWRDADTGRIMLDEHKTAKAISTSHLPLDDQGGSYWAVATATLRRLGLIGDREVLRGIEYNFIRKALPDTRPKDADGYATNKPNKTNYATALDLTDSELRKLTLPQLEAMAAGRGINVLGDRSKVQPQPLFLREQIHRTSKERTTQLRRIQDEAVQMEAVKRGIIPLSLNPTRDCTWDCEYETMCRLKENGGAWEDIKRSQFYVEDPYMDHRKSSED